MINKCKIKIVQRELYNVRDPPWRRNWKFVRKRTIAAWIIAVTIFNQYILEHTIYLLGLCREKIYLDNSSPFLFDYLLKSILTVKSFIRAKFSNPLSINSLFWAWIQSYLGPRIQKALLQFFFSKKLKKIRYIRSQAIPIPFHT